MRIRVLGIPFAMTLEKVDDLFLLPCHLDNNVGNFFLAVVIHDLFFHPTHHHYLPIAPDFVLIGCRRIFFGINKLVSKPGRVVMILLHEVLERQAPALTAKEPNHFDLSFQSLDNFSTLIRE